MGIGLNKPESLFLTLLPSMQDGYNLKKRNTNKLARIMAGKLTETKQTFNDIERICELNPLLALTMISYQWLKQ